MYQPTSMQPVYNIGAVPGGSFAQTGSYQSFPTAVSHASAYTSPAASAPVVAAVAGKPGYVQTGYAPVAQAPVMAGLPSRSYSVAPMYGGVAQPVQQLPQPVYRQQVAAMPQATGMPLQPLYQQATAAPPVATALGPDASDIGIRRASKYGLEVYGEAREHGAAHAGANLLQRVEGNQQAGSDQYSKKKPKSKQGDDHCVIA
eukprot:TRINITY_DN80458_c0_g1_i1.p1 TRINITY_DN80458_c0_g1~~TRINITY_DN80458_c0_g1_i1.p1  ORF type:complete len:202 (+),score=40.84 TRINITY_DN80458_c0_g1_i1:86-691(+)